MIDPGLKDKVVLVTGANNPYGIGAAIAQTFAAQGAYVFIHYFRRDFNLPDDMRRQSNSNEPSLAFYFEQQAKSADQVMESIRASGGKVESWECDLREPANTEHLFARAEKAFGHVDILVNNAADHLADTFIPPEALGDNAALWEGGPALSTVNIDSHNRHFAVNSGSPVLLMAQFARRIIERDTHWGRIINISADCAWGCPQEISYRASKYALESFSRSAAAELGPYGITVNIVSPGPVQSSYISAQGEKALIPDIPLRRIGRPEDIARAVLFFASRQADWITGQLLFVHGGHRMALGR